MRLISTRISCVGSNDPTYVISPAALGERVRVRRQKIYLWIAKINSTIVLVEINNQ
jgi:hypothetical protein